MNKFEREARMAGWKKTMDDVMKGNGGYMVTMDTVDRECMLCKSRNHLQRCSRCMKVFYCSRDCQRGDWRRHKEECQQAVVKAKEKEPSGNGSTKPIKNAPAHQTNCKKCGASSNDLKTCGRCGEAKYCSKECQQQDWPDHKRWCRHSGKTKSETDWEAGKMFEDLANAMDPSFALPVRRSRRPTVPWEEAIQQCVTLHSDKVIITDLKDVTLETNLDPVQMTSTVFLARLSRPHFYVFRNAWYLEDRHGKEVRIFFYLDNDISEPYFKFSQLDRGNYLCLEHTYIHTFLDGTTGIRVDDACDVSIIGD